MNCREFSIEFEERGTLSETARLHLTVCADCQKTSARQTQIWLMIEDFKPVVAPNDFDFHVKARIAQAKPSDFHKPAFLPILRYVLPLSVAVLLLGIFVINSQYFSNEPMVNDFAQKEFANSANGNEVSLNVALANQMAIAPPIKGTEMVIEPPKIDEKMLSENISHREENPAQKESVEIAELPNNQPANSSKKRNEKVFKGNHELSFSPPKIIYPRNANPNLPKPLNSNMERAIPLGDEQILTFFGIETVNEDGKYKVKSLQKDKEGERSGVKIGDVIEQLKGNTITILRGIEKFEITLK